MKASLFALVVLGACTGGSSQQVITGQVAADFPSAVTAVRVVHAGSIVATAPVAADGSFRLAFAPSNNLAIQLVSGGKSKLVFPRHIGGNQTLFAARAGGGAFDLGKIHFVADTASTPITFHDGTEAQDCEDGHDASGAVCADDSDSSGGSCEAEDDHGGSDAEGSGSDDVDDGLADDGDAVPEHNFPADGCSDDGADDDHGSNSGSDGSDDGSGSDA